MTKTLTDRDRERSFRRSHSPRRERGAWLRSLLLSVASGGAMTGGEADARRK
jgi:hypothetical protein